MNIKKKSLDFLDTFNLVIIISFITYIGLFHKELIQKTYSDWAIIFLLMTIFITIINISRHFDS